MTRVLLLLPTTTYRASDFLEAARRLDVDVTVASEEPNALASVHPDRLLTIDFRDPEACVRRVREFVRIPTATNTVVVNFEQLAACVRTNAIDVILLDTTFWGGLRQAWKASVVCEKFQLGVAVHSSGELGIQLATMLHLGAALPNLSFAADAHYHHLIDDIIRGGKMRYVNGAIAVPAGLNTREAVLMHVLCTPGA